MWTPEASTVFHILIDAAAANLKGANLAPERDQLEKRIHFHHRQQGLQSGSSGSDQSCMSVSRHNPTAPTGEGC